MSETIEQYLQQIRQVEEALILTTNDEEKKSLVSLKEDLKELLSLTQEADHLESTKPSHTDADIDDEFKQFMSEIRELDNSKESSENSLGKDDDIGKDDFPFMKVVGNKCSAPHTHSWGGKSYHNAMICEDNRLDDKTVRVLFTNPTHQEMLPCNFYLSGHCRFDESKCRFSHGEIVLYSELKDYKEPDFSLLRKPNCSVLFRMDDNLWHKGIISSVDFDKKVCKIKLQQKKCETDCDFEFILPIDSDNDGEESNVSDDSSSDDEEIDDTVIIRNIKLIEQSLMTAPSDRLGQWEEHTRGVGSRLMEKMGYIIGTGLGKNGEGIITPISAQVLPPGRSLDHCMNLREQANGDKNLFSVEKKLKRQAEKQKAINEKAYAKAKNNIDVFSFINDQIFASPTISSASSSRVNVELTAKPDSFTNHSTKNLNLANFEISENIRKIEKEIHVLNQSLRRHKEGSQIHTNVRLKIDNKKSELSRLQTSEKSIKIEQNVRNNKNKLLIF